MARDRKAAQDYLINIIDQIAPGGENKAMYQQCFDQMSDKDFDKLMQDFETGAARPPVYVPNFGKTKLTMENLFAVAKKMGHNFFQKLVIHSDDPDEAPYLTPVPYMVIDLPLRRQAQLLVKKISIPEHNKSSDQLTGQPTGASKSARISYPELQIMRGMGLDQSLVELMKFRGGDIKGFDAMNRMISKDGTVSMKSIEHLASGVESTKALKTYLTCMHLQSTL